jgi:hypothetical protein
VSCRVVLLPGVAGVAGVAGVQTLAASPGPADLLSFPTGHPAPVIIRPQQQYNPVPMPLAATVAALSRPPVCSAPSPNPRQSAAHQSPVARHRLTVVSCLAAPLSCPTNASTPVFQAPPLGHSHSRCCTTRSHTRTLAPSPACLSTLTRCLPARCCASQAPGQDHVLLPCFCSNLPKPKLMHPSGTCPLRNDAATPCSSQCTMMQFLPLCHPHA